MLFYITLLQEEENIYYSECKNKYLFTVYFYEECYDEKHSVLLTVIRMTSHRNTFIKFAH